MLALRFPDDTGTLMIGTNSKVNPETNEGNTFLGIGAGKPLGNTGTNNYNNTFLGTASGNSIEDGCYNTCIGAFSGSLLSTSNDNILIGSSCGKTLNTDGNILIGNSTMISDNSSKNIILGHNPTISEDIHNSIGIGNSIQMNVSNCVYVGNEATEKVILNCKIFSKLSSDNTDELNEGAVGINETQYLDYQKIILKLFEKIKERDTKINEIMSRLEILEKVVPEKNTEKMKDIEELPVISPETTFQIPIIHNMNKKSKKAKGSH